MDSIYTLSRKIDNHFTFCQKKLITVLHSVKKDYNRLTFCQKIDNRLTFCQKTDNRLTLSKKIDNHFTFCQKIDNRFTFCQKRLITVLQSVKKRLITIRK